MNLLPDRVKRVYLRLIEPVAEWLVRHDVQPNTITTIGTLCSVIGGIIYGTGHIRTGGWFLGLTALFDVLDGMVARRTNRSSLFGAFYDSTLDRVADGFVLGGLAVFFSTRPGWQGTVMVAVCVLATVSALFVWWPAGVGMILLTALWAVCATPSPTTAPRLTPLLTHPIRSCTGRCPRSGPRIPR